MIIYNKRIPFKGFIAMAIFPFIFVRKDLKRKFTNRVENHEKIHFEQQKEMLIIFFYLWYIIEWLFKGYKNISFEREANGNEENVNYLKNRKRFIWLKYL